MPYLIVKSHVYLKDKNCVNADLIINEVKNKIYHTACINNWYL